MTSLKGTATLAQISEDLDFSYKTLRKLSLSSDFPTPVAHLSSIRLYNVVEVARYLGRPIKNF